MKTKKALDAMIAKYADALAAPRQAPRQARGGEHGRTAARKGASPTALAAEKDIAAEFGAEGKVLMNTIQQLHSALRPVPVPEALALRVKEQVRREIEGRPAPLPTTETAPGFVAGLRTAAQAFVRRAGELVLNINLGELLREKVGQLRGRPAEVYAYSVIEALDKAARRRKARILVDAKGRIYEVPQSVLKRRALTRKDIQRRKRKG